MNVYCKMKIPSSLSEAVAKCLKHSKYDDYGQTEFYIFHVTPTYKIERYVDKKSGVAGERYMQLKPIGYADMYAWEYVQ